ncbi:MAG: hypothetical protein U0992_04650 [Planctomycetaceae bacterium]
MLTLTAFTNVPDVTPAAARWLRVAALLLGLSLGGAACVAAQLGAAGHSPGAVAAAAIAALAALPALGLVLGPTHWQAPLWNVWHASKNRLQGAPVAIPREIAAALMAVGGVAYLILVARLLSISQNPWDDDQGAFLLTAQEIHDHGGLPWLWRALWSGEFAEANRHPLYLGLLALCPSVRGGQWLSVLLGVATFVVLVGATARRFDRYTAGLFSVLLGTNAAFCLYSTRIVCEILLVLLCGLAWLMHTPSPRRPDDSVISPARCSAGGALLGLAWLTKGTGLVLFVAYGAWLMLTAFRARRSIGAMLPPLACALAAFVIVSLPLLVRNTIRFGNPVHNLNSLLLFADHYDDLAGMVDRHWTTGQAARAWWVTHSAYDAVRREATGLIWEAYIILRSFGPAPLDDARLLFGLPLAVFAIGLLVARPTAAGGLLVVWGAASWLMFAWYVPIAAGERFILPLLGPALILAAAAVVRAFQGRRAPQAALAAGIVWSVFWVVAAWFSAGFGEGGG